MYTTRSMRRRATASRQVIRPAGPVFDSAHRLPRSSGLWRRKRQSLPTDELRFGEQRSPPEALSLYSAFTIITPRSSVCFTGQRWQCPEGGGVVAASMLDKNAMTSRESLGVLPEMMWNLRGERV